jgi:hypothetical protein
MKSRCSYFTRRAIALWLHSAAAPLEAVPRLPSQQAASSVQHSVPAAQQAASAEQPATWFIATAPDSQHAAPSAQQAASALQQDLSAQQSDCGWQQAATGAAQQLPAGAAEAVKERLSIRAAKAATMRFFMVVFCWFS